MWVSIRISWEKGPWQNQTKMRLIKLIWLIQIISLKPKILVGLKIRKNTNSPYQSWVPIKNKLLLRNCFLIKASILQFWSVGTWETMYALSWFKVKSNLMKNIPWTFLNNNLFSIFKKVIMITKKWSEIWDWMIAETSPMWMKTIHIRTNPHDKMFNHSSLRLKVPLILLLDLSQGQDSTKEISFLNTKINKW